MTRHHLPAALLALVGHAAAAEGLWQPQELPTIEESLHAAGLAVDPRELADPQGYPLNAVVELGDRCTATLVSPLGLLLGNRHCVLDALSAHVIDGRDPLRDGLLAPTLGEELPGMPSVRLTVSVQEVSAQVRAGLPAHADHPRDSAIESRKQRLLAACASVPGHRCRIHALADGSRFWLVRQLEIPDVRLAFLPAPAAAGADASAAGAVVAGADFALLRAYVGPDGTPAPASESNVPLRPPAHLRLQSAGLATGDFAMAVGHSRSPADAGAPLRFSFGTVNAAAAGSANAPLADLVADFGVASSSGSPLLNARAELVGIVFADGGAAPAALGAPQPSPARAIAVDIRHVLGLLEAADDSGRLLGELAVGRAAVHAD